MRVYISGPIKGRPDGNRTAFLRAYGDLRTIGHEPVNPHDVEPICIDNCTPVDDEHDHAAACYLRGDIEALVRCDAILMLDGWTSSAGAKVELDVALACSLIVFAEVGDLGLADGEQASLLTQRAGGVP